MKRKKRAEWNKIGYILYFKLKNILRTLTFIQIAQNQ